MIDGCPLNLGCNQKRQVSLSWVPYVRHARNRPWSLLGSELVCRGEDKDLELIEFVVGVTEKWVVCHRVARH